MRKRVHGTCLLHSGHSAEALDVFAGLARDRSVGNEGLTLSYLSIACCHFNLGAEDEAQRFLDFAELAIHAGETVFHKGYFCGLFYALYSFRGNTDKASEWKEFLNSLPCPDATKEAFLGRGERFVNLCREHERLVVF